MNGNNNGLIITILAIIGGIVVLGWVLKIALNLLGPLILVGVAVLIYIAFFKDRR